ncbi:MAG: SH3 domain-containing protein, partial [Anaerolineae bacterium]|nr:SH3 domain-containing protein [Anaerolineae bacterium]
MKKTRLGLLILLSCLILFNTAFAQDEATRPAYRIQVFVDSAFVRAAPSAEAKPVASIFEGNVLEAVGRNADGRWFEVRRPGRVTNLGWVSDEFVSKNFTIELLPLTDSITGVTGADVIADSGFAVFVQQESTLRDGPLLEGGRLGV